MITIKRFLVDCNLLNFLCKSLLKSQYFCHINSLSLVFLNSYIHLYLV